MTPPSLKDWLQGRQPPVPGDFLPHLTREGGHVGGPEGLADRGMGQLHQALDRPGREREAAFRLLAADAFITYACEAAVEGEGALERIEDLLIRLGERPW